MVTATRIEWCEAVWNPLTGCTPFSKGCEHCYAKAYATRLHGMGKPKYANNFDVTLHPDVLGQPLSTKRSQRIFVNSMSDFFHKDVPLEFIQEAFKVMDEAYWHQFLVLTKRSVRMMILNDLLSWAPNIGMGVTVEHNMYVHRINHLRITGASLKFVSFEPLLSRIPDPNLNGLDWVIAGGENGPGARTMEADWVRELRDRSLEAGIPFFFKGWGRANPKHKGILLDGREWRELPFKA